ncbi:MAG: hypothetical protein R3B93_03050 [Bacteroidia bacterium]
MNTEIANDQNLGAGLLEMIVAICFSSVCCICALEQNEYEKTNLPATHPHNKFLQPNAQNPFLQEQGKLLDRWLKERFSTIIPDLMKRTEIDMWLLISREYNEDPVLKTMLPSFLAFGPKDDHACHCTSRRFC